jgi:glutathione reductase (NADPH)
MTESYDLVVIGSGVAGTTVATTCREAGWSVAVIDSRPFGGTCVLRGCDPKRVLLGGAELVDGVQRLGAKGALTNDVRIDWPGLMAFKSTFTDPAPAQRERLFTDSGITAVHGRARFVERNQLAVGDRRFEARYIVIAGGARHRPLGIPGEDLLATSTDVLSMRALPQRVAFAGAGYISMELAHLFARAGAQIRIFHSSSPPMAGFDQDMVRLLMDVTREIGVGVHLDAPVRALERAANGELLVHVLEDGRDTTYTCDLAVHGAGRIPEIDDLDLSVGGVTRTKKGVAVDEHLQSQSNPSVYAAGDAADAGGLPLTPVALYDGEIVAANLLHGNTRRVDYTGLATCVFTIPPLATVGITEQQARERNLRFDVKMSETTEWYSSRRVAARRSAYKILVEASSGKILGATLLGPQSDEVINLFVLALREGITADRLREAMYAYPTGASDLESML